MPDLIVHHASPLLLLGGLLILSAFFSGSETAFFSLDVAALNRCRRRQRVTDRALLALHRDLGECLVTILLGNLFVNLLFFAGSTLLLSSIHARHGAVGELVAGVAVLLVILNLGEIVPKTLGNAMPEAFAKVVAIPLYLLHQGLAPLRGILARINRVMERIARVDPDLSAFRAEELRLLVRMSRVDGVITDHEHALIQSVMELPAIRAGEIMTPRTAMVTCDPDASPEAMLALARSSGHAKLPVRDTGGDDVTGWVDVREWLGEEGEERPPLHVHPVVPVSEFDRADQILRRILATRQRMLFVVDERGALAGLLTIHDIAGEIFGEIGDEDAPPDEPVRMIDEQTYRLSGLVSVREWRTLFGVLRDLPRVATMGGLVTALLGRTARVGDAVTLGNLTMTVTRMHKRRVDEIRLTLKAEPGTPGEEASCACSGSPDHRGAAGC